MGWLILGVFIGTLVGLFAAGLGRLSKPEVNNPWINVSDRLPEIGIQVVIEYIYDINRDDILYSVSKMFEGETTLMTLDGDFDTEVLRWKYL